MSDEENANDFGSDVENDNKSGSDVENDNKSGSDEENDNKSGSDVENEAASHSAALKRLKTKDPDFYEFLQANDKNLLDFEASESEDENASENEEESKTSFSAQKLEYIKSHIKDNPSIKLCKELIAAFKQAVNQADGFSKKNDMSNSDLFSDIIKLCLIELVPALNQLLNLTSHEKKKNDPSKSKKWKRAQNMIKSYLIDLLKLFSVMKESSAVILLLKHTVHLIPFFTKFIKLSRLLLKKAILLWSSDEETVRVLSLIIIVRTTKSLPEDYLGPILKSMYFAFVKNTKFTSPTSWPMINFMKRSLTEVYSLNLLIAYEHAFIYIRQLAIHLRNALTTKKKESFQTVYNWQFVHCVLFWGHLLGELQHDSLKTLIYPLVQTVTGTINLIPTARYVPLRFHLIRLLIDLSQKTNNFIPTVPFVLDVLTLTDFNKKSSFSVKSLNFACSLKVTKSQLLEAAFKEKCINEVCDLLISYFKMYSHSVGFPELALPAIMQIKSFMKQCKIPKYNQQLKTILGKIEENIAFISEKRRSITFSISDLESIKRWEENIQELKTPLLKYNRPTHVEEVDKKENEPPKKKTKLK